MRAFAGVCSTPVNGPFPSGLVPVDSGEGLLFKFACMAIHANVLNPSHPVFFMGTMHLVYVKGLFMKVQLISVDLFSNFVLFVNSKTGSNLHALAINSCQGLK